MATGYSGQMIFHLLIQSKVCVTKKKEKGGPYNEHSKYSMPTGCRFYPKKVFLVDVFSPFRAYAKLCFPTNWRSLVITGFHSLTALDQFPSFQTAFSGFQSRYPFRSQVALSGFQLDLSSFFFLFFIFLFIFHFFVV